MFFVLSKIGWWLVEPGNLLLLGLVAGAVLLMFRRTARGGRRLTALVAVAAVAIAVLPVGGQLLAVLETRFPIPKTLPQNVAGIVILGGAISPVLSAHYGRPQIGGTVERLTEGAQLAKRYPDARVIFTGGTGSLKYPNLREAPWSLPVFRELGLAKGRVEIEQNSRNTYQNAVDTLRMAKPKPGEHWILVTSAFHMPRAVGCFRAAGWPAIIPYPVDFLTLGRAQPFAPSFDLLGNLQSLATAEHEYIGLLAYRLTGRIPSLFPGP